MTQTEKAQTSLTDEIQLGLHKDIPLDDYHNRLPGLSSTQLKELLRSPAHFKSSLNSTQTSKAMELGQAIHCAILEPELFAKQYAIEPPGIESKTKNPGKKLWDEFKRENADKQILYRADGEIIEGILAALRDRPRIQAILSGAETEISAFARDKETDVLCKARADIFSRGAIVDVKTTTDARNDAFIRDLMKFRYHLSAAFYLDVFERATGERPVAFIWLVVEKTAPFGLKLYQPTPELIAAGRAEYRSALKAYAECVQNDSWPCYDDGFESIELPAWYKGEVIYE